MKVYVGISVLLANGRAYGQVEGELRVSEIPQKGDVISFLFPSHEQNVARPQSYSGQSKVVERVIAADSDEPITLMLEDILLASPEEALELKAYLDRGFGLSLIPYD